MNAKTCRKSFMVKGKNLIGQPVEVWVRARSAERAVKFCERSGMTECRLAQY